LDSDHEISSQDTIILEQNLGEFEQKQLILSIKKKVMKINYILELMYKFVFKG
jgi:hypothetical protein